MPADSIGPIVLSVMAPAHNEEDNIGALVEQIDAAVAGLGVAYEIVLVDDGSTDRTRERIRDLMATRRHLRCVAMAKTPPGRGNGQSAAFHAGFRACRGELVAMLDADLQNDPADIGPMLDLLRRTNSDMVQGDRSHARKDNAVRKVGSIVGRLFRRWLLGDTIRDTGCSLRLLKREIGIRLPLEFAGMHRFIPVTARHLGYAVVEMPVRHRPRVAGTTKYGLGITKRALPGLRDLLVVRWMRARRRPTEAFEVNAMEPSPARGAPGAVR
ncbi:MAG: glycosyltransferase family 2 protein [Phycisphaerae bacterium]|nr:glycosyltransferase family 2 protein [Phycisphaerae bacterium]